MVLFFGLDVHRLFCLLWYNMPETDGTTSTIGQIWHLLGIIQRFPWFEFIQNPEAVCFLRD
jgi:hypothetical protein